MGEPRGERLWQARRTRTNRKNDLMPASWFESMVGGPAMATAIRLVQQQEAAVLRSPAGRVPGQTAINLGRGSHLLRPGEDQFPKLVVGRRVDSGNYPQPGWRKALLPTSFRVAATKRLVEIGEGNAFRYAGMKEIGCSFFQRCKRFLAKARGSKLTRRLSPVAETSVVRAEWGCWPKGYVGPGLYIQLISLPFDKGATVDCD